MLLNVKKNCLTMSNKHNKLKTITGFYEKSYDIFAESKEKPEILVSFYSYVNLNHTIRIRNGKILVRISEMLKDSPLQIHEALAIILITKLLRCKTPENTLTIYRRFISTENFRETVIANRREKGKKIITSSKGTYFDLDSIFEKLNEIYFDPLLSKTVLSWSKQKTYRRLGHYDPAHNSIIISKSLDNKKVPEFVVEYVVYHEMLHIKHPTLVKNGRRYSHTPEFKFDEEKFDFFYEAEKWINQNGSFLKRAAKKSWF